MVSSLGGGGESRKTTLARATFVPVVQQAGASASSARFRVQVASLVDVAGANAVADRVRQATGREAHARWSEETRTHQVRVGELPPMTRLFASRAGSISARNPRGLRGCGSVRANPAERIRLIETGQILDGATVLPADPSEILALDANEYRGYFEVRPGRGATVTAVNVLGLEDYLRGVVPNELSPQAFPEIEALKAQAVAARTYAIRNRGQFAARGYDICATPSCQVYRGRSTEASTLRPGGRRDQGDGRHLPRFADPCALYLDLRGAHRGWSGDLRGERRLPQGGGLRARAMGHRTNHQRGGTRQLS